MRPEHRHLRHCPGLGNVPLWGLRRSQRCPVHCCPHLSSFSGLAPSLFKPSSPQLLLDQQSWCCSSALLSWQLTRCPPSSQGQLVGLCGNFDLKTVNEMRTPENLELTNPQEFGSSWAAVEVRPSSSPVPLTLLDGPCASWAQARGEQHRCEAAPGKALCLGLPKIQSLPHKAGSPP